VIVVYYTGATMKKQQKRSTLPRSNQTKRIANW